MSNNQSQVSIEMLVYNGNRFLEEALDSILVQRLSQNSFERAHL
jgi:hypothetical protein